MSIPLYRGLCAVSVLAMTAQIANADLTAQDVWSDWRDYMAASGYQMTATEKMTGNRLTVSDLTMSLTLEDQPNAVTMEMGDIDFDENADGTVAVVLPDTMPIRIASVDGKGEPVEIGLTYAQRGFEMLVSGDPQAITYDYSADNLSITLASLVLDGVAMPPEKARAAMRLNQVKGDTNSRSGDTRGYVQKMVADTLTYDVFFDTPDTADVFSMTGSANGFAFDGTVDLPKDINVEDVQAMLAADFSFDGTFEYRSGTANIEATTQDDTVSISSTSQGGNARVAMDKGNLTYDLSQRDTSVNMTSAQLPFPVALNVALSGFKLSMPIAKADEPQDFALALRLEEFKMSEMIWGMFDPGAVLPRDPATVVVDLAGKAKVLVDLLDPKTAADLEQSTEAPGQLDAVTINQLLVSAAGAKLTGTGDFVFDNSVLNATGGMPKPAGAVDLKLVGGNALIDKLIKMGFVSEQDAMGARMMMGVLGVPGDEPDSLTSKIEINDQGHVIANGQRIQ